MSILTSREQGVSRAGAPRNLPSVRPREALLHGPAQIADLPVPVGESPGAVSIGHAERGHLVEYLTPNSVFNSLPRQCSSPHLGPHDRLVRIPGHRERRFQPKVNIHSKAS